MPQNNTSGGGGRHEFNRDAPKDAYDAVPAKPDCTASPNTRIGHYDRWERVRRNKTLMTGPHRMDPVSLDPEHGERDRNNSPVWLNH